MDYTQHYSTRKTPQSESAKLGQVQNHAGGHVFPLGKWKQLDRFLILGTEGNTYYATEHKMTVENARVVQACLAEDYQRAVKTIVDVSFCRRAPKNDPAIFALAIAAGDANPAARKEALSALGSVCRIGTHLFQFLQAVEQFRGWGRGLRTAVGEWYTSKSPDKLAYQLIKYKQRGGWSHRDVLRLAHPKSASHDPLFRYVVKGDFNAASVGSLIYAHEEAKTAPGATLLHLIDAYGLTWEMLPTEALKDPAVWDALLPQMPMTAMLRNLGRMTANGLLKPLSDAEAMVVANLSLEAVRSSWVHPMQFLTALATYGAGKGLKGSLTWKPTTSILQALDRAFVHAFPNVQPTGKRTLIGLDISGSMGLGAIAGSPLKPCEAAAALAMVTMRTEPRTYIHGFSGQFVDLAQYFAGSVQEAIQGTSRMNFGRTDCALPMVHALQEQLDVDTFVIYTDNETWAGNIHPFQALQKYRELRVPNAKLVVVGMTATEFSIANPDDPGMLDVVGFDTATPQAIAAFTTE